MNSNTVYTALSKDTVWVRVIGKGTFQNSHPIKKWLLDRIEAGCLGVFIDLGECISMDSTFMGIVTGISLRMKKLGRGLVTLINVSAHNIRLLETLGLDKFLTLKEKYDVNSTFTWEILPIEPLDKIAITKHMLEAHDQLMDTGGLAAKQFKNVYKLLKEELEKQVKKNDKDTKTLE